MMQQMEQQQKMIEQLQKKIDRLQTTEHPPKTVIEKIEYHFDQLKIETLEGTLQIGLTPNGSELSDLGDLYSKQGQQLPQNDDQVLHALQEYMTSDVPSWMNQYVRDHDIQVSDTHKERMIEDVRKQLPHRMEYYRHENPDAPPETLFHQIKSEVQHSMAQYFETFQGDDDR